MRVDHWLGSALALPMLIGACDRARTSEAKHPAATAAATAALPKPSATTPSPTQATAPPAAAQSDANNATSGDLANVDAAVTAAQSWLKLVDSAKYDESWQAAATLFQHGVSQSEWSTAATKALSPLGKLRSRRLRSTEYQTSLPGAPDGKYVVIRFDATFENKAQAIETITPMQGEDGAWKVAGYFVK